MLVQLGLANDEHKEIYLNLSFDVNLYTPHANPVLQPLAYCFSPSITPPFRSPSSAVRTYASHFDTILSASFLSHLCVCVCVCVCVIRYGTFTRMNGLLSVISEELPDCPLYYTTGSLCATVKCNQPSFTTLRSAFLHAGYRVSVSHANQDAVKTDAPPSVVWDIMRSWVKKNPVKPQSEQSPAYHILKKESGFEADFSQHKDANPASRAKGISRFPELPPNWGPKSRAKKRSTTQASAGANPKRQRQQETTNIVAAAAKSVAAKAAAAVDAAAKAKGKE